MVLKPPDWNELREVHVLETRSFIEDILINLQSDFIDVC